jgi:hypothetical protein
MTETGLPSPQTPEYTGRPKKKRRDWHDITSLILLGFTFLSAVAAAGFTGRQAYLANKQLRVSRDTLAVTQDTEKRQLRAYMLPEMAWLANIESDRPVYEIHTKNYGQTPAYKTTVWVGWRFFKINEIQIPSERPNITYSQYAIGPQGFTVDADKVFLDADRKKQIREGNGIFFLFGDIRYVDIFSTQHQCNYRFVWKKGFEPNSSGSLMLDTEGNDQCD